MYTDLKKQLEQYNNTVFYYGLTEDKISGIEKGIGKKFPAYFREFPTAHRSRAIVSRGNIKKENRT